MMECFEVEILNVSTYLPYFLTRRVPLWSNAVFQALEGDDANVLYALLTTGALQFLLSSLCYG